MPAHLLEPAIVGSVLANEDHINGGLHVVINPARTCSTEESKRLVVRVEHHLLGLSGIGPHKRHPAVAETDMGNLDRRGHAVDQNNLVAPVELRGFAGIEAQRHIRRSRRFLRRFRPLGRIAPHRIIAAAVTAVAQLLVNPDERQAFPLRSTGVLGQHRVQLRPPGGDLRAGLCSAVIGELCCARPDHLAHGVPRHPKLAANLLDRLAVDEVRASDLRNRLHDKHPLTAPSCL